MAALPSPYGVGLAYRFCLHESIMTHASEIDLLEIPTEDYIVRARRVLVDPYLKLLNEAISNIPSVAHGIQMSIGSVEPFDDQYLNSTLEFLEQTAIETFSEHLTFHRMNGVDLESFLALPFTKDSVEWVARKYNEARSRLGRPFALENISYYFSVPECELSEADFLCELLALTDCTLLLDVTNVFNNSVNHGYDPEKFIRSLPGDRVTQIHLAGGRYVDGMWIDDHSAAVMPEVWPLFELALEHTGAEIVILERDDNFDPFDAVMNDIRKARTMFKRVRGDRVPATVDAQVVGNSASATDEITGSESSIPIALQCFQQGLLGEITRDSNLLSLGSKTDSKLWQTRLNSCDPSQIDLLKTRWKHVEQRAKSDQAEYARREWQLWRRDSK